MAGHVNCSSTRRRPRDSYSHRQGRVIEQFGKPRCQLAGVFLVAVDEIAVSPSTTISGMPPTRVATTAVSQAIASRLTKPTGSYTEGQTKAVAELSRLTSSGRGMMPSIQPGRPAQPERAQPRLRPQPRVQGCPACLRRPPTGDAASSAAPPRAGVGGLSAASLGPR